MKSRHILLVIFALAVASPVIAEQVDSKKQFRSLDTDNNGFISIIEATGHNELLMKWSETDRNTDGQLEISEFSAFEPGQHFVPPDDEAQPDPGAAPF